VNVILGGAALYALYVGSLYLFQDKLVYRRDMATRPNYPLPEGSERLELRTSDGETIVGNLVRARRPSRGLVIGFSGNAWNADDCTTFIAHRLDDVDIAVFHYRGYEPSSGTPAEAALFADALLIHDTLVKGMAPDRVYAFGFSLGSGVAAYLAANRPLTGQLLVTPFDSIEAIARKRYRGVPVRWLIKSPFRSVDHLAGKPVPTAVILASDDRIVPRERSERLIEALERPVLIETIPDSTHVGIYDMVAIDHLLRRSLDVLEASAQAATAAADATSRDHEAAPLDDVQPASG
jgi:pimeloyl-ACP methyl ester carboxylesterase